MDLKNQIRIVENFPKEGISFKDITTLLLDGKSLHYTIDEMCKLIGKDTTKIVGPEARGFILGTAIAYNLGLGFVPVRKPGKLPAPTESIEYDLEYGTDILQVHSDSISKDDKVVIVDDLLATGGTLNATAKLIEKIGGNVSGIITLIELTELGGRDKLKGYNVESLIKYEI